MDIISAAGKWAEPDESGATYVEQFARPDLSIGTYSLRAGAIDLQSPHSEDEVYVVTRGHGQFTSGGETIAVTAGSMLYVPAHEAHRFNDITEDLAVLVFFGPAYGSRSTGAN